MSTLFGGSSPSGSATSSTPATGTAQVYTPQAQPAADQQYQNLISSLISPYTSGTLPPQQLYPQAQNLAQTAAGPYANYWNTIAAEAGNQPGGLPFYNQALYGAQAATDPLVYLGQQALTTAGNMGGVLPQSLVNAGQGFYNTTAGLPSQLIGMGNAAYNAFPGLAQNAVTSGQNAYNSLQGLPAQLIGAGQQFWNTAQDPQSALYLQLRQQAMDQANASNAAAGLSASPYASSLTQQSLNNLGLNWQNQQLQRQATGLGGLGTAFGQASGITGQGLQDLLSGATTGTNLNTANLQNALSAFGSAGNLGAQGVNVLGSAYGQAPQIAQALTNLGSTGAQQLVSGYGLPEQTLLSLLSSQAGLTGQAQGGLSNAIQGLGAASSLGLSQYALPQQVLNDLQSYLGLGQAASGISGTLGNQGFNQGVTNALLGGAALGAGSNALFGSGGLTGFLGGNPQTGLLGALGLGAGAGDAGAANLAASNAAAALDGSVAVPSTFLVPGTETAAAGATGGSIFDLLGLAAP